MPKITAKKTVAPTTGAVEIGIDSHRRLTLHVSLIDAPYGVVGKMKIPLTREQANKLCNEIKDILIFKDVI